MRPPRVRFTMGTLLFSVAVAAANLWAFRRLTETEVSVGGSISYRVLPAGVGVIPLVDAALIGIWLCVSRWLRSVRQGHVANPRSSSSLSAAYFRLQLLMLGGLAYLFMPDAVGTIRELLECATEITAEGWAVCFGDPGETVPWLIAESSLLGVLVSGPPLVLSWIGQRLAKRCAAALPRPRFLALTGLVSLGFASAGLAIAVAPQPFEDEQEIAIDFQVVDRVSNRPIAAAFLCMTDPFSYDPDSSSRRAFTEADGRVQLTGRFVASGERNAFQMMGTFSPWGRWLEVSAAGHRTVRIPLTEVLGPVADPARPCVGRVVLDRGPTPENAFGDLAGTYCQGGGFGGSWFKIEPDGRFAWAAYDCTSTCQEYGTIRRRGELIELTPIPHPGEEIHPLMTRAFRRVIWGQRRYLAMADDRELRGICHDALAPFLRSRTGRGRCNICVNRIATNRRRVCLNCPRRYGPASWRTR